MEAWYNTVICLRPWKFIKWYLIITFQGCPAVICPNKHQIRILRLQETMKKPGSTPNLCKEGQR
jgi:hypothetical protein